MHLHGFNNRLTHPKILKPSVPFYCLCRGHLINHIFKSRLGYTYIHIYVCIHTHVYTHIYISTKVLTDLHCICFKEKKILLCTRCKNSFTFSVPIHSRVHNYLPFFANTGLILFFFTFLGIPISLIV